MHVVNRLEGSCASGRAHGFALGQPYHNYAIFACTSRPETGVVCSASQSEGGCGDRAAPGAPPPPTPALQLLAKTQPLPHSSAIKHLFPDCALVGRGPVWVGRTLYYLTLRIRLRKMIRQPSENLRAGIRVLSKKCSHSSLLSKKKKTKFNTTNFTGSYVKAKL